MALVFQYGSNTSSKRINSSDRLQGDACPVGIAYTKDDFELEFTIWSQTNKCASANIKPGSGRKIWGVLYEIPDYLISRETSGKRKSLDAIEGEGKNYKKGPIALLYQNGLPIEQKVITYVGVNRKSGIETSLKYACHIIKGLREHKIPDDYTEYVKTRVIANNPKLRNDIKGL
jgi:hypothetical protein